MDMYLPTQSQTESVYRRIWRLTNSKFLYGVVILLAIPSFILGVTCGIEIWIIKLYIS